MRVRYENQDCDEEYEVVWSWPNNHQEESMLYDTLSETEALRSELESKSIVVSILLLTTYYDAFGDRGLTESKLIYRTGEEVNE